MPVVCGLPGGGVDPAAPEAPVRRSIRAVVQDGLSVPRLGCVCGFGRAIRIDYHIALPLCQVSWGQTGYFKQGVLQQGMFRSACPSEPPL